MKLFNIHLSLTMQEVGDPDKVKPRSSVTSLTEGFKDDSPIKDAALLLERLQERGMFGGGFPLVSAPYPGQHGVGDHLGMEHQFQVIVGSFEEMQDILAQFRKVADKLTMPMDEPVPGGAPGFPAGEEH